jgi:hypothetical protein
MKTFACGLATMTRDGGTTTRPDEVLNSSRGTGLVWLGGRSVVGGLAVGSAGTGWEDGF